MILCVYNVNDTDLSVKKSNGYYCSVILYDRAFIFKNEEWIIVRINLPRILLNNSHKLYNSIFLDLQNVESKTRVSGAKNK